MAQSKKVKRTTSPVGKRTRIPLSCTYCRRRKIRCDGEDPCSNCDRIERVCIYEPVPSSEAPLSQRKRGNKPKTPHSNEAPLPLESTSSSSSTVQLPSKPTKRQSLPPAPPLRPPSSFPRHNSAATGPSYHLSFSFTPASPRSSRGGSYSSSLRAESSSEEEASDESEEAGNGEIEQLKLEVDEPTFSPTASSDGWEPISRGKKTNTHWSSKRGKQPLVAAAKGKQREQPRATSDATSSSSRGLRIKRSYSQMLGTSKGSLIEQERLGSSSKQLQASLTTCQSSQRSRTASSVPQRLQGTYLATSSSSSLSALSSSSSSSLDAPPNPHEPHTSSGPFTDQEDATLLFVLLESGPVSWSAILDKFESDGGSGRTKEALERRWALVLRKEYIRNMTNPSGEDRQSQNVTKEERRKEPEVGSETLHGNPLELFSQIATSYTLLGGSATPTVPLVPFSDEEDLALVLAKIASTVHHWNVVKEKLAQYGFEGRSEEAVQERWTELSRQLSATTTKRSRSELDDDGLVAEGDLGRAQAIESRSRDAQVLQSISPQPSAAPPFQHDARRPHPPFKSSAQHAASSTSYRHPINFHSTTSAIKTAANAFPSSSNRFVPPYSVGHSSFTHASSSSSSDPHQRRPSNSAFQSSGSPILDEIRAAEAAASGARAFPGPSGSGGRSSSSISGRAHSFMSYPSIARPGTQGLSAAAVPAQSSSRRPGVFDLFPPSSSRTNGSQRPNLWQKPALAYPGPLPFSTRPNPSPRPRLTPSVAVEDLPPPNWELPRGFRIGQTLSNTAPAERPPADGSMPVGLGLFHYSTFSPPKVPIQVSRLADVVPHAPTRPNYHLTHERSATIPRLKHPPSASSSTKSTPVPVPPPNTVASSSSSQSQPNASPSSRPQGSSRPPNSPLSHPFSSPASTFRSNHGAGAFSPRAERPSAHFSHSSTRDQEDRREGMSGTVWE